MHDLNLTDEISHLNHQYLLIWRQRSEALTVSVWKSLFPNLTKEMAVNKGTLSAISDKFTLVLITKVARRFTFWLCKYCHFHTSSIQTQTRQSTFLGCKAHSMSSKVESQMLFIAFLSFLEISECILQRDKRAY